MKIKFTKYYSILSSLDNVVNEIVSKKLHGCQIPDLVYKYTISGNSEIKKTFNEYIHLLVFLVKFNLV